MRHAPHAPLRGKVRGARKNPHAEDGLMAVIAPFARGSNDETVTIAGRNRFTIRYGFFLSGA